MGAHVHIIMCLCMSATHSTSPSTVASDSEPESKKYSEPESTASTKYPPSLVSRSLSSHVLTDPADGAGPIDAALMRATGPKPGTKWRPGPGPTALSGNDPNPYE